MLRILATVGLLNLKTLLFQKVANAKTDTGFVVNHQNLISGHVPLSLNWHWEPGYHTSAALRIICSHELAPVFLHYPVSYCETQSSTASALGEERLAQFWPGILENSTPFIPNSAVQPIL